MALFNKHSYLSDTVRTAIAALLLHRLRTVLSLLGIIFGVMAVLSIIAIGEGAKQETLRQIDRMGITNIFIKPVSLSRDQQARLSGLHSDGLQLKDMTRILKGCKFALQITGSRDILLNLAEPVSGVSPKILACTGNYNSILQLKTMTGRFINDQDNIQSNLVCVLGNEIAKKIGSAGKVGRRIRIGEKLWKIVGILKDHNSFSTESNKLSMQDVNEMIFLPINSVDLEEEDIVNLLDTRSELSEIIVEIDKKDNVRSAAQIIDRILEKSHNSVEDFHMIVPLELLAKSMKIQRVFNLVFGAVGALSLIIGGIGIMNIMLAGVSERTREIGLRLAVGATETHIIGQFIFEALLITISGGILGVFFGIGTAGLIASLAGWPVSITAKAIFLPLFFSIGTGLFFGIFPAIKAARLDPIKALSTYT